MESLNPHVTAAAKLPILNPNEFDLWKMRIEQYFLMIDYSLWEVILNGDSPSPTRIVDGVVQIIAPITAEQRLANKNELKARGTLLMALPDKHQLKFNIHKDAKTLMEAIEKRFGEWKTNTLIWRNKADLEEQSLNDLFNNLKIYEAEVKGSSTSSQNTQNIAFMSSNNTDITNELVSVIPSVSATSSRATLDNDDLKQIDPDDLEEMDLKWQMAMLTMRARMFLKRTRRNLGTNGTDTIGFDMSKVECYNCHIRGHFSRECRSPRDNRNKDTLRRTVPVEVSTSNALVSQCDAVGSSSSSGSDNEVAPCSNACSKSYATLQTHYDNLTVEFQKSQFDVLSYKTGLESVEARLVVYQQNESVFKDAIKLLKLDVMLRDNALAELRKKFEKAKKERDDLKLTLDKFQTSSKNLSKLPESQVSDKTDLGFDSQVFDRQVFECEELNSHESDNSVPTSLENDRYKTGEGYHAIPPLYIGVFLPFKTDLVFNDAPNASESVANVIESVPKQKEPSFVLTSEHVKTPRESVKKVEPNKQAKTLRTNNQKTRVLTRSRLVSLNATRHVPTVVPQSTVKNLRPVKHVFNKAHSPIRRPINHRPSTKNSNFNKKVTTIKVNKVNVVQGVKGNADKASANWQTLKDKSVIGSGCSRHMTGNISFLLDFKEINGGDVAFEGNLKGDKITGKDPLEKFDGKADEGFLVGYSVNSKAFKVFNSRTRIVQETLHINFLKNKPNAAGIGPKCNTLKSEYAAEY
nr:hypothetical protein [Tanacetum cinerariifolium]